VIAAMEDAIQKAARSRYGSETEVRAEINRDRRMRLSRLMLVVDQVENDSTQIAVDDAKKRNPAAQVGDHLGSAAAARIRSHRGAIRQAGDRAEGARAGATGNIRNTRIASATSSTASSSGWYGNVIVDLGRGESDRAPRRDAARETFRNGDRIRAFIYDVRREPRGPISSPARIPIHGQAVRAGSAGI
jgi:N utilization substance protein A